MLMQRVLTVLVLLPPVVACVWLLPNPWLMVLFGAVGLLASQEWSRLAGCSTRSQQLLYVAAAGAVMALLWFLRHTAVVEAVLGLSLLWWLWMVVWIRRYPQGMSGNPPVALRRLVGLLVIPAAIWAVTDLHASPQGPWRVLYLFFLIWAADVGAYFAGRAFGRRKLAPQVSPGKTWEGVAGGVALASVIVVIGGEYLFHVRGLQWLALYGVSILVVGLSVIGDLSESILKRQAGVKDSGTLLPGHGGVLDRIDSMLAAAPALALGLQALAL